MTSLIGTWSATRLACEDGIHLLAVSNRQMGATWCVCGRVKIPGHHVTHHERFLYDHAGQGAVVTGYDQYMLPGCDCHPTGAVTGR